MDTSETEVDRKIARLAEAASQAGVDGVLLTAHWNVAWLTGGRSTRIDISREAGAGALLVGADGRRFVIANAIEMPRLLDEVVPGLGFEPVEFPWISERADPALAVERATARLGSPRLASDLPLPGTQPFDSVLSRLRRRFEPEEVTRCRTLGSDVGEAVGSLLPDIAPGVSELDVVSAVGAALFRAGARPLVLLAAADERLLRYRHPIPTNRVWTKRIMVAVCAERHGLVVALSRMVAAEPLDEEMVRRVAAAQRVFAAMLDASRPGAAARTVFDVAARAYAHEGFDGEERYHHQGGAIGYRSREWIAHPASEDILSAPSALAWNPSITGTEDRRHGHRLGSGHRARHIVTRLARDAIHGAGPHDFRSRPEGDRIASRFPLPLGCAFAES